VANAWTNATRNAAIIRAWLEEHDILLAGRYSEWAYYNSDHAFLAGKKATDQVRERQKKRGLAGAVAANR
jgi:UDP-galactopyranose mutase